MHDRGPLALLALALVAATAGGALGKCGDRPGDALALRDARDAVEMRCPCARSATHGIYLGCAMGVARELHHSGLLPKSCVVALHRCTARSTCGRAGAVACCLRGARCKVLKSAARCAAKGGRAGTAPSCCDSCATTTTVTTTTSTTLAGGSTTTIIGATTTSSTTTTTTPEGYTCAQNRTGATQEPIVCGDAAACTLSPAGDSDSFLLTVPDASVVSIELSGSNNPCWDLRDMNGASIKNRCSNDNPQEAGPLAAGTYTILVTEALTRVSNYVLSVQGIDESFQCATPLTLPASVADSLDPAGDTDAYTFAATGGETVHVTIAGPNVPCWRLFAPNGQFVKQSCTGADAGPLAAGMQTIVVRESLDRAATYTLSIQRVGG
jgi:hypothetical protein